MRKETLWRRLFLLLLVTVTLAACTDSDNSLSDSPQSTALDEGPSFTDKAVDVNRDGNAYGQVSLRFYSDKPSVAYISVAEFYRIMTGGETMKVERQGDLYKLTGHDGTATVDVKDDYLYSTNYSGFVNLLWMIEPDFAPNTTYDDSKYLTFAKIETPSMFKPAGGTRLDFKKYEIDLHDDGTSVYVPFATLADMYSDMTFHNAACHDDKVVVSTIIDMYTINTIDPEFAAKPYQQAEVTADMAKYRYQELCFVFDNFYGYPGRTIMEQNGMAENGFDATLDLVENGPLVKRLLQSANNMDFAWGRMALDYLLYDGGHTLVNAMAGMPDQIYDEYSDRLWAMYTQYPEADEMYVKMYKKVRERNKARAQLEELRGQAYGDVLYKANSDKTLGVIIMDSFNNQNYEAWNKYYASPKGDADWQELMNNYETDDLIAFLYALQQAKADGVKNLILDISLNGGGSTDIVFADIALLRKNRALQYWSQNILEGKNNIRTFLVDSNFDGFFDERDNTNPKIDCSDMNIAVLSSKVSFSCGDLFSSMMKEYGYPIFGERTGGGSCSVQVMLTPDGQHYQISTYRDRATDKRFMDYDKGIAPNDGYAFDYSKFCDLDFLNNKINEFYSR